MSMRKVCVTRAKPVGLDQSRTMELAQLLSTLMFQELRQESIPLGAIYEEQCRNRKAINMIG